MLAAKARAALTSTILVTEVREPPDIPQANDLSSHRQYVFQLVVPLASFQCSILLFFLLFHASMSRYCLSIANCTRDSVIHPTFKGVVLFFVTVFI